MIKRFLVYGALALGLVAGGLLLPVEAQYGGYTTVAPQYTTANLPTCSSAVNAGALAWDTTTTSFKICDGSAWAESGTFGGTSLTVGTANTIARFGAADLEDSSCTDDGATMRCTTTTAFVAAGASGDIFTAADSSGIVQVNPSGASADGVVRWKSRPDASESGQITLIDFDPNIMDGADVIDGLFINIGFSADPTGGSLNAIRIDGITSDADAVETAMNIGAGYDRAVHIQDGSLTDDVLMFGAGADVGIYWNNSQTRLNFDATGTAGHDFQFVMFNDNASLINFVNSDSTNQFILREGAHTASKAFTEIFVSAPGDPALNDIFQMLNFDWNETEFTADAAEVYGIGFDTFTADANATYTAIHIGAGWDTAINIAGDGSISTNNLCMGAGGCATDMASWFNGTDWVVDVNQVGGIEFDLLGTNDGQFLVQSTSNGNFATWISTNVVNTGLEIFEISVGAVNATNGSDVISIFTIDWNETDWATDTETLNAINIDNITQDAQGSYNAIQTGTGWDRAINVVAGSGLGLVIAGDGSLTDDNIAFGDGQNAVLFFDNTALEINLTTGTSDDLVVVLDLASDAQFLVKAASGNNDFRYIPVNAASFGSDTLRLRMGAAGTMNGSDTINFFMLDWNDTSFATGTSNTLNLIDIEGLTGDAQSNLNAIKIGVLTGSAGAAGELETAINIDSGWDVGIQNASRYADTVQAVTGADGAGRVTVTVTPTTGYVELDCQDIDTGCLLAFSETGAIEGQKLTVVLVALTAGDVTIPDEAGVLNGTATTWTGVDDTLSLVYTGGLWVETSVSVN